VSAYRTPDERFAALPGFDFAPRYVEQDALRMHYVDEGSGDPVLLLHGEPTWAYLYRRVIPQLAGVARCVAPDYFGFGRSDKPLDRDWYSYDSHFASLERLVEELDLRRLTVVVQDWGGPLGLRLAVEHADRVARLVRRTGGEFQPGQLIRLTCRTELADEVAAAYDAPFPTPESKTGVTMFPELVPDWPDHPSAEAMLRVREALRAWPGRALVFFGDSDPIFSPRVAERLAELIPNAELQPPIAGAGHFVQEDAGEEVGRRIAAWLSRS